ncbi:unnamed protein product [Caenorhabditis angaria]|uniref:DOMON domain-containing protein n=1 Tax=Caenorhabditis angaria TaxID=860376 RepID=A0A9P1N499_9PELO|nr:unnamed protein product [Caenorhabditis angaria]
MNSTGCGTTKICLFKPRGCNPNMDCTTGVILEVVGENQMKVQMVAATIVPPVQQQYVAIAFSDDQQMGNDSVTECVISNMGEFVGYEPEVYLSYNKGKSNDRVFLNDDEHQEMFKDLAGEVIDSRMVCEFTQQIIPQIDNKNGLVWSLKGDFYVMAATGSAQPDEVNAHEMNRQSHFFPITSEKTFDLTKFGNFDHPTAFVSKLNTNRIEKHPLRTTTSEPEQNVVSRLLTSPIIALFSIVFFF